MLGIIDKYAYLRAISWTATTLTAKFHNCADFRHSVLMPRFVLTGAEPTHRISGFVIETTARHWVTTAA